MELAMQNMNFSPFYIEDGHFSSCHLRMVLFQGLSRSRVGKDISDSLPMCRERPVGQLLVNIGQLVTTKPVNGHSYNRFHQISPVGEILK